MKRSSKQTALRDRPKDAGLPPAPPRAAKQRRAPRFTFKAARTTWRRAYYACGRCHTAFLGPTNNRCGCPVLRPNELHGRERP